MIMLQAVPFVALFAAMATLVSLNRKYELVIARSAGISAWQFLFPCCIGALLFGVLSVGVLNPLAAHAFSRSELLETPVPVRQVQHRFRLRRTVAPAEDQRRRHDHRRPRRVSTRGLELADAVFFVLDAQGDIVERKDAARAYLRDGYWELQDVRRFSEGNNCPAGNGPGRDESQAGIRPGDGWRGPKPSPSTTCRQRSGGALVRPAGPNAFAMQFHSLMALPFLLVAMTLIAATVSMRFARMGQSATMILGGVLAGFLLYVVSVLVKAFGNAGFVPPFIAGMDSGHRGDVFRGDVPAIQGGRLVGVAAHWTADRPGWRALIGATAFAAFSPAPP